MAVAYCLEVRPSWTSIGQENQMAVAATRYEHIVLNHAGVPTIAGTTMKISELVVEQMAYG